MNIGLNSPTQGFTDRARAAAEIFGPGVMLWLSSSQPQDGVRFPSALHIVRLDNWTAAITPTQYAANVAPQVTRWRSALPGAVFQCGNESDLEAGHNGEDFPAYAAALRAAYPGILLANPPLSVEATGRMRPESVAAADYVACHSYIDWLHPETLTMQQFGQSYQLALAAAQGKPVVVTEAGVSNFDGMNWPGRNTLLARWLSQAAADGVHAATLFIADGLGTEWASFDIGAEAAAAIRNQFAPPPPPPPPPENTVYTPSYDPRGYRPLDARWLPFIAAHNLGEAAAICESYDDACRTIGYDANAAIAQGCVETAIFTSQRWRNAHNAAGIGIYSDGTPDVQFGDVQTGIRAQAELLSDYYLSGQEPWGILKRYGFGGMNLGKAKLSDMDGVWAADTGYSIAIAGYLNSILGGDAPAPSPTPAPSSGIPGDRIAAEALTQLNHARSGTYDTRNGDHPWYLWCESFVERVHEHCGLTVAAALSAADQGRAMDAAGRLHRGDMNAPRGAILFWDERFWVDGGHTAVSLGDGTFVGTVSPEGVGIRSGWQTRAGYMGWAFYPGVGEGDAPAQEVDEVKKGDGFAPNEVEAMWFGTMKPSKTARAKTPYEPDKLGTHNAYRELVNGEFKSAEQDFTGLSIRLGKCLDRETGDPGTPGRSVIHFTEGKITALKQPDGSYLIRVN